MKHALYTVNHQRTPCLYTSSLNEVIDVERLFVLFVKWIKVVKKVVQLSAHLYLSLWWTLSALYLVVMRHLTSTMSKSLKFICLPTSPATEQPRVPRQFLLFLNTLEWVEWQEMQHGFWRLPNQQVLDQQQNYTQYVIYCNFYLMPFCLFACFWSLIIIVFRQHNGCSWILKCVHVAS